MDTSNETSRIHATKQLAEALDIDWKPSDNWRVEWKKLLAIVKDNVEELEQFRQVSGLDCINYRKGRRLPDPGLKQDPAYLAMILGEFENEKT